MTVYHYQCRVRDAKSKDNKGRWVDCEIVKGKLSDLDKSNGSILVKLHRAYFDEKTNEIYEKENEELLFYKKDIRLSK